MTIIDICGRALRGLPDPHVVADRMSAWRYAKQMPEKARREWLRRCANLHRTEVVC